MNRRTLPFLFLALAVLFYGLAISAPAQSLAGGAFQNNQIGSNAFVSSPKGEIYLVLNNQLYHSATDDGDSWDQLVSDIKAVAIDPSNERVLYGLDTKDHVIKSLDSGKNWITLNTGFPNLSLLAIYVNPANPQEVFVGSASGLFKTIDAGFTWHSTSFALAVNEIFVNPRSPSNQYLLSAGLIFMSTDGGSTWKKSEAGLPVRLVRGTARTASKAPAFISLLVFVDWQSPFLLATTFQDDIVRSDDGGVSWKTVGAGESSESFVTAAVGRQRIVLCSANHLYSSGDGRSWKKINIRSGRNSPVSFMGVVEHPKRDGLLLHFRFPLDGEITNVGAQKRVGYLDANDVLVGLNYGVLVHSEVDNVWTTVSNGMNVLFATTANVYALDQVDRYTRPIFSYMSTDDGHSWELLGKPACGESITRSRGAASEMWVYGGTECVSRTQDGGVNWQHLPGFEFRYSNGEMRNLRVDANNRNIAYYTVGVNERYLFRYQYNSESKQGQAVDLKTLAVDVLTDEANPSTLFTDTARLSTDGGWTWTDKSRTLSSACKCDIGKGYIGPVRLLSFRKGEIRALISYRGDAFNGYPGAIVILRSQDSGDTWSVISQFESHRLLNGPFSNPDDPMNAFFVALSAKGKPGVFGTSYTPDAVSVLETRDGGATWHEIYSRPANGQFRGEEFIRGVAQITRPGGRSLFLASKQGLLRSEDEGRTWKPLGGIR